MTIDNTETHFERTAMNFWDVCGTVGGITSVLYFISSLFLKQYSDLVFKITSINLLFPIKSKKIELNKDKHLEIKFID